MKRFSNAFTLFGILILGACSYQNPSRNQPFDPIKTQGINLNDAQYIDLSHSYEENTLYWPTSPTRFQLESFSKGMTAGGWFYSANSISMPEHGGTHLDAPIHFDKNGLSNDEIPLTQLIGEGIIIDITEQSAKNPDYRVQLADIKALEKKNGSIPKGAIILLRTNWSKYWPNPLTYLGDDTKKDASNLHFPSFGVEATNYLIKERGVKALGVDTASTDYGQSKNFIVHRLMGAHQIPGMENLTNLDKLPYKGFWVIALPIKTKGGSGGPLRAIAIIPN